MNIGGLVSVGFVCISLSLLGCGRSQGNGASSSNVNGVVSSTGAVTGFEDRGHTFFARVSGREWQKEPAPNAMKWEAAKEYCGSLALGGSGWRLPTKDELLALYQSTPHQPVSMAEFDARMGELVALYADKSSEIAALYRDEYWSSSAVGNSKVWSLGSSGGFFTVEIDDVGKAHRVRCVR